MATALLVDAHNGAPLALTVLCQKGMWSTESTASVSRLAHLDQVLPPTFIAPVTSTKGTPEWRTGVGKTVPVSHIIRDWEQPTRTVCERRCQICMTHQRSRKCIVCASVVKGRFHRRVPAYSFVADRLSRFQPLSYALSDSTSVEMPARPWE